MATTRGRNASSHYTSTGQINRDASPSRGSSRTLTVKVVDATPMVHPITHAPLADPMLYVGLGKQSKTISLPSGNIGDRFNQGDVVHMPYNGEAIMRLMLSDGVYQCGWADVECGLDVLASNKEIPVKIISRNNKDEVCGTVTLNMKRSSARVQTNVDNECTPLSTKDKSKSHVVDDDPTAPPSVIVESVKSVRVRIHDASELEPETENVYVMIDGKKPSKVEARGPTVKARNGQVQYLQTFVLPAREGDEMIMRVYENEKMKRDPLLGEYQLSVSDGALLFNGKPMRNGELMRITLNDKKGQKKGMLNMDTIVSTRPETSVKGRVEAENDQARSESTEGNIVVGPPSPVAADSDDESIELGETIGTGGRVTANTVSIKIVKPVDESPNSFVKTKLGKKSLRAEEYGEIQGDEMVFPYTSEKWLYFCAQQDVSMARDPITGVGKLDLEPYVGKEYDWTPVTVDMFAPQPKKSKGNTSPATDKPIGKMQILLATNPQKLVTKPLLRQGPDLDMKSELAKGPKSIQIDVARVVDPPAKPGSKYQLVCNYGKASVENAYQGVVSSSGEAIFNQSFISKNAHKKYAKISLVNCDSKVADGHTFINLDRCLNEANEIHHAPLSANGGTIVCSVMPIDRVLQNSGRWVDTATVNNLKNCNGIEMRILAAYDLKYDSTKDVLDPYCIVRHGPEIEIEGKPRKNAGLNPILMTTYTFPVIPGEPIKIDVCDKAVLHKDTLIGSCVADMEVLKNQQVIPLLKDGAPAGMLLVTLAPLAEAPKKPSTKQDPIEDKTLHSTDIIKFSDAAATAGPPSWDGLNVHLICARNLGGTPAPSDKSVDPVYNLRNGKDHKVESVGYKSSSLSPTINKHFVFPKTNSRILRIDVSDKKLTGKKIIGSGNIDLVELDQVLRGRRFDDNVSLDSTDAGDNGLVLEKQVELFDEFGRPAGSVFVHVSPSAQKINEAACLDTPPTKASRKLGMPTCTTEASSCAIRIAEGENINEEVHPFIKLNWMGKSTRTRTLTTQTDTGRRLWQDDMLLPCIPAQTEMTFHLIDNVKMARDTTLGTATVPDVENILNSAHPVDRWVEFTSPSGKPAGKVHMIFTPSEHIQPKLCTVPSAEAIPKGTYNSVKLTIINGHDFVFDHGKDICDPLLHVQHDTFKIKGKTHKDGGVNPTIMETFTLPVRPGYPIDISVCDDNKLSGNILIGNGKVTLPDLIREQPAEGVTGKIPIYLGGRETGVLNYNMTVHKEKCDKPSVDAAPKNARNLACSTNVGLTSTEALYEAFDIEIVKLQDIPVKGDAVEPYVYVVLGSQKVRGHTVPECATGTTPVADLFKMCYQPVEFIKFEVYDDQKLRRDPVLSSAKLALNTIACNDKYREMQRLKLPLFKPDGSAGGNLYMKVKGHESPIYSKASVERLDNDLVTGSSSALRNSASSVSSHGESKTTHTNDYNSIRVEILNACNVGPVTCDPYVIGRIGSHSLRTQTVDDAGQAADFGDEFYFPYSNERKLKLTLFDNRKMRKDEELGYCKFDLDPVVADINKGEPQIMTGHLVNKKTGELTHGQVTVIVTPQRESVTKAYAISPENSVENEKPVRHPNSCLIIDDVAVENLKPPMGTTAVNEKFSPYLMTKLGRSRLRSGALSHDHKVHEGFQWNMTKAPGVMHFDLVNNIKFHPDQKLGTGQLDLSTLKSTQGQFRVPQLDHKTGTPTGAVLTGDYMWCDKPMKKKAMIIQTPESARAAIPQQRSSPRNVLASSSRPSTYRCTIEPGRIPFGDNPYAELCIDGKKTVRYDEPFKLAPGCEEIGFLPAGESPAIKLTIRDNKRMQIDPVLLEGLIDVSQQKVGEAQTYYVNCSGPRGYQEIDVHIEGLSDKTDKPHVETAPLKRAPQPHQSASPPQSTRLSGCDKFNMFVVEITTLVGLKKVDVFSKNDPYAVCAYNGHDVQSDVFTNAGTDAVINTAFFMPLNPEQRYCSLSVKDKETFGKDKHLGTAVVDLQEVLNAGGKSVEKITIHDPKRQPTGCINCTIKFDNDPTLTRPKIVKVNFA